MWSFKKDKRNLYFPMSFKHVTKINTSGVLKETVILYGFSLILETKKMAVHSFMHSINQQVSPY